MPLATEIFIVGGGPAGSAIAIILAEAGMQVVLVEQQEFPRQKVCGECISAGALSILDELGVGDDVRAVAGPEIRRLGWIGATTTVTAPFPRCTTGSHGFGRALGRDSLDSLLMIRARNVGVEVLQPARVRHVTGTPGDFLCEVETQDEAAGRPAQRPLVTRVWNAQVVVDAHGSWERGLKVEETDPPKETDRTQPREGDLFGFKATFTHSTLAPGLLPVIAFPGGYGGMVVADDRRTTLACCIRRDALRACRALMPGHAAGLAVAATLRRSCRGVAEALASAVQELSWLSVGPIRPGVRLDGCRNIFRVGNAAGESHPLIGEGINMALSSSRLAATYIAQLGAATIDASRLHAANRAYAAEWRSAFGSRMLYAQWYAQMAMRPAITNPLNRLLAMQPSLMTHAARWAGKARGVGRRRGPE